MPKTIDPALRAGAVRLMVEQRAEYPSTVRAIAAVARYEGVGAESLHGWVVQAEIDAGDRDGQISEGHAEIRQLKAENRRLHDHLPILRRDLRVVVHIDDLTSQNSSHMNLDGTPSASESIGSYRLRDPVS